MEIWPKKRSFLLLIVCVIVFQGYVYVQAQSPSVANNPQTKELKNREKSCQCKKNDLPVDKAVITSDSEFLLKSDRELLLKCGVGLAIAWMILIYVCGPSGGPE